MANETAKRLIARLRELREAHGLSQEAFAERAGLKYKHYQSIEAGRKIEMRLSTLQKLAKACGMELWELLNFDSLPSVLAEDAPKKERARSTRPPKKR
ncbi:MAG: helix-turn-helix transcriptional regulator [Opitutaceae bacterium]